MGRSQRPRLDIMKKEVIPSEIERLAIALATEPAETLEGEIHFRDFQIAVQSWFKGTESQKALIAEEFQRYYEADSSLRAALRGQIAMLILGMLRAFALDEKRSSGEHYAVVAAATAAIITATGVVASSLIANWNELISPEASATPAANTQRASSGPPVIQVIMPPNEKAPAPQTIVLTAPAMAPSSAPVTSAQPSPRKSPVVSAPTTQPSAQVTAQATSPPLQQEEVPAVAPSSDLEIP